MHQIRLVWEECAESDTVIQCSCVRAGTVYQRFCGHITGDIAVGFHQSLNQERILRYVDGFSCIWVLKTESGTDKLFLNELLNLGAPVILFVTVACGAVSGFHSLVSSGTSSKTVSNEKDMLKVGYGAMVLESLLAVLALCVAGAAAAADGTPAAGTPFQVFSSGVAGFFEMFGVPVYVAQCFMTMCVSALALTSLDAVARIGRMSFQELFSVDDMEHAEGWRKFLCNTYFSTILTLVCAYVLTRIGYANIWPLFGSANQLLSALVLVTLCVFLKVTGRSNKMLFPPLIIMLCVTGTALVERTIGLVKAYQAGSAVFLVEGLQLIIAVLLMALGLVIVINSLKAYFGAKKESEA